MVVWYFNESFWAPASAALFDLVLHEVITSATHKVASGKAFKNVFFIFIIGFRVMKHS
ncbi:hypothetical protein D3C85_966080 [compost metagenome]